MTIICTGSIAYDYLMVFPGYFREHIIPEKLESISLSFLVESMVRQRGGTAPNIAYTLALLGDRPKVMGTVGEDFSDYRQWLEANGIDTELIKVIPGEYTASFFANTDRANSQISSFYAGAMAYAATQSLQEIRDGNVELIVISPNDPAAMHHLVEECRELKMPYLYDPSQQVVRMDAGEMRFGVEAAQCVFLNEYEYYLIQKHTGMSEQEILSRIEYLVVTLAEKGAMVYAEGRQIPIPVVPPAQIVDPTGVGDAFRGGFLRGRQLGLDWETCGKMGALAGTYCLENRGTQNHHYTPADFVTRYRQHFDDQGVLDALLLKS